MMEDDWVIFAGWRRYVYITLYKTLAPSTKSCTFAPLLSRLERNIVVNG